MRGPVGPPNLPRVGVITSSWEVWVAFGFSYVGSRPNTSDTRDLYIVSQSDIQISIEGFSHV